MDSGRALLRANRAAIVRLAVDAAVLVGNPRYETHRVDRLCGKFSARPVSFRRDSASTVISTLSEGDVQ